MIYLLLLLVDIRVKDRQETKILAPSSFAAAQSHYGRKALRHRQALASKA